MIRGLYTAYTGMGNEQKRMDIITNNLANTDTTGFKKEGVTAKAFQEVLALRIKDEESPGVDPHRVGNLSLGVKIGEVYTDWSMGPMKLTDNPYDITIAGKGFFAISYTNKAGETSTKYTRDGNFALSKEGYLVTQDGDFVLGTNGNPVRLDPFQETLIDEQGQIFQGEGGTVVAQLQIADFDNYDYLEKYGENLYTPLEGATRIEPDYTIVQGYLEASNVETVHEMVDLIAISRNYETNQKVIQTMDNSLRIAANDLGKMS